MKQKIVKNVMRYMYYFFLKLVASKPQTTYMKCKFCQFSLKLPYWGMLIGIPSVVLPWYVPLAHNYLPEDKDHYTITFNFFADCLNILIGNTCYAPTICSNIELFFIKHLLSPLVHTSIGLFLSEQLEHLLTPFVLALNCFL